jgi:hypothetical protein
VQDGERARIGIDRNTKRLRHGRDQEQPVGIELRGGPERTRTACQARRPVEPVSDVVTAQLAGLELSLASRRLGECDQLTTSLPPLLGLRLSHTGEICLRPVEARHESDTWGQRQAPLARPGHALAKRMRLAEGHRAR